MTMTPLFYLLGDCRIQIHESEGICLEGHTHPSSAPETMCSLFINCTQSSDPLKMKYERDN